MQAPERVAGHSMLVVVGKSLDGGFIKLTYEILGSSFRYIPIHIHRVGSISGKVEKLACDSIKLEII